MKRSWGSALFRSFPRDSYHRPDSGAVQVDPNRKELASKHWQHVQNRLMAPRLLPLLFSPITYLSINGVIKHFRHALISILFSPHFFHSASIQFANDYILSIIHFLFTNRTNDLENVWQLSLFSGA